MRYKNLITCAVSGAGLLAAHSASVAAIRSEPSSKPAVAPTAQPQKPAEPTLDELLGLPKKPAQPAPQPAPPETPQDEPDTREPVDPRQAELERQLAVGEVSEEFEQAVALMGQTADRLDLARDAGLETQRLQEEVLRKLDKLIEQANQQQGKGKSKKKKGKPDQSESSQQQAQSSQSTSKSAQAGTTPGGGPDRQDGELNPPLPGSSAAWGTLPEHIRDALHQGSADTFSSVWKQLTEQYYKRLAEEPRPAESR